MDHVYLCNRSIRFICKCTLCRYIELLQALILFTPTDHADKVKLQKFVEQLDQLNNEVKEVCGYIIVYSSILCSMFIARWQGYECQRVIYHSAKHHKLSSKWEWIIQHNANIEINGFLSKNVTPYDIFCVTVFQH